MPDARVTDPPTSHAAAKANPLGRSRLRSRVLGLLAQHPRGLTDDELCDRLNDAHPGSVSKRRHDLLMDGFVDSTGRIRLTRTGSKAIEWTATDKGLDVAISPAPDTRTTRRSDNTIKRLWDEIHLAETMCPMPGCGHQSTTGAGVPQHLRQVHGAK